MSDLKIGDVCIIVGGGGISADAVGLECTIIGPLEWYECVHRSGVERRIFGFSCEIHGYEQIPGTHGVVIDPRNLRKKRPPEETTTWDQCVWQPHGAHRGA